MKKDRGLMRRYYFRVDPREIYFFKFILEGYDGLGVINTIDREKGLIRVVVPECQRNLFDRLVSALSEELLLVPVAEEVCNVSNRAQRRIR